MKDKKDLTIGSFYMPHRNMEHIKELDKSLDHISNKNQTIILTGDFNCPDINWNTMSVNQNAQDKEIQRALMEVIISHSLTQIHETPTRGNNLLDIVLTSNPSLIKTSSNAPGISDHDMIVTDCDTKPHYQSKKPRKCYIYSKAKWEDLHKDLTILSTNIIEMYHSGATVQELWDKFKTDLYSNLDNHIPSKLIRSKTSLPWINHKIRKMFKKKTRLYQQAKKTNNWTNYRHFQKECKRQIRKADNGYGENYGKDNKDKEISDFCENISILDCPGFVNSELRANAKSIRQCLERLSDSDLLDGNNNSKKLNDHSPEDVPIGIGGSGEHGPTLSPYHETNKRDEKRSETERHCNNVASSSAGNSNVCVSDTIFKGLKVNDSLIRDKTSSECNHFNENSQLGLPAKTLIPMPSLMNNWNTNTDIWSGSSTSNHISNTSLNNGASGSSTTHVDTHKGSNTPMIMANKDQLYISGSSQENYTHTLQNNTGLVSNSMTMTADTTSNQQTLLNTPVELTVRRNSYSQSINIDSPVSTNQLERRQT
ncbi:unnamed protein product [Mytilus edulis]|uniref:Endonuclease/exonuclease/phosphatase domain-containing protein n=1 Tax=Mytilus edulis TaxID=6550 RepID=A0A8S3SAF4_MYTED|nr:unnamed protein product [Mytilus edulis]